MSAWSPPFLSRLRLRARKLSPRKTLAAHSSLSRNWLLRDSSPLRLNPLEPASFHCCKEFDLEWSTLMRKFAWLLLAAALLVYTQSARATILGSIRGIVHDPQHRPIADATVKLQSSTSAWSRAAQTNSDGEFEFDRSEERRVG